MTIRSQMVLRQDLTDIVPNTSLDNNFVVLANGLDGAKAVTDLIGVNTPWHSGNCAKSLAETGWQKLASGMILQWGVALVNNTATVITLPIAFPAAAMFVMATVYDSSLQLASCSALTKTNFSIRQSNTGPLYTAWFATGY